MVITLMKLILKLCKQCKQLKACKKDGGIGACQKIKKEK